MKTLLLRSLFSAILPLSASALFAASVNEVLVTTMDSGGQNGVGVIYSINPDGSQGSIAVTFNGTNGANPSGNLINAPDNRVYGTTVAGGSNDNGVLFRLNPANNQYAVVHHFNGTDGSGPRNLFLHDNTLYGTTAAGGTHIGALSPDGMGVLYSYNIQTSEFYKLIDFDGMNGENPQSVIRGVEGSLYGLTRQGGENGFGVLYRYNPTTHIYKKLHDFDDSTGSLPTSTTLYQASNYILYGTTTWGGQYGKGVLFSFNMAHDQYTVLHHFNGAEGAYPIGTLTEENGVLYGVTEYGGNDGNGTVYSYNISTGEYTVVHAFNVYDGKRPTAGLTVGADGNLYGLTNGGGNNGKGVVYSINPETNTYTILTHNSSATGVNPLTPFLELAGETATGINEVKGSMNVYPIPSANTINFNITNYDAISIAISDINGAKVYESAFTNQVDISKLAAGSYMVQISGANGVQALRTRIVKQ
jgi:uncharacterized repeat protein (TIGR03803 family)